MEQKYFLIHLIVATVLGLTLSTGQKYKSNNILEQERSNVTLCTIEWSTDISLIISVVL
jgi:hypothetical protein